MTAEELTGKAELVDAVVSSFTQTKIRGRGLLISSGVSIDQGNSKSMGGEGVGA